MTTKSQPGLKPTIWHIIWGDYAAFMAALWPVVIWIVCAGWLPAWRENGPVIPASWAPVVLLIAVALTGVAFYSLARRIRLFWEVFASGAEVRGRILKVSLKRDHGSVEYTYIFGGEEHTSGAVVHRTERATALKEGDRVVLIVDRQQPKRAFIRDLYL